MKIQLAKHEEMLFALLRAALKQEKAEETFFLECTPEEWNACYKLSVEQGVMALAWDGIITLPIDKLPPRGLKLKWAVAVNNYERQYQHYCKTIQDLSNFYASHGIVTVQMKGVGFSSYYPIPSHREGGDIDIYTYSADHSVMSDKEANDLADRLMEDQGIKVDFEIAKHSVFYYRGVPIENHKHFLDIEGIKIAASVETVLKKVISPISVDLLKDGRDIMVPSQVFNTLFLSFHAMHHYGTGMKLHHLCDWACLLNKQGLYVPKDITNKYFLSMIYTLTAFTNRYLGTNVNVACPDKAVERMLFDLFHSPYLHIPVIRNPFKIFCHKMSRFMYIVNLRKEVMGESVVHFIGKSILLHLRKPAVIFKLK